MLGLHAGAAQLGQQLAAIRRSMAQVQSSNLAPDDKRARLDSLIAARNQVAAGARPMIRQAEGLPATP